MAGLYFEEFVIGRKFVHEIRRTVTDMDNMMFSSLTYNPAAIHIDHAYAAGTEFGRPLMNSIFTLGLVIGLSIQDTTFGVHGLFDTNGPVTPAASRSMTTNRTASSQRMAHLMATHELPHHLDQNQTQTHTHENQHDDSL